MDTYQIPKGTAAFFRRNDEDAGVIPYRMMAWLKREDYFRSWKSTANYSHKEHLQSMYDDDYAMMHEYAQYRKELERIFIAEFCAPEGAAEFFEQT